MPTAYSRLYSATYSNDQTRGSRWRRFIWQIVWGLLGRPSPVPFFKWRRMLATAFGARIDPTAFLYPKVRIWDPRNLVMEFEATLANGVDCYNIDLVFVGPEATVSQDTMLCTASHDLEDPGRALVTKSIRLERASWVFARAFIGPGVTIGEGGVVGAGSIVVRPVEPWSVVAGNPARVIKRRNFPGAEAVGGG